MRIKNRVHSLPPPPPPPATSRSRFISLSLSLSLSLSCLIADASCRSRPRAIILLPNVDETHRDCDRLAVISSVAKWNDDESARNDLAEFASPAWQSAISIGQGLTAVATRDTLFIIFAESAPSAAVGFFYFAISLSFRWTDPAGPPTHGRTPSRVRSLCQFGGIIGSRRSGKRQETISDTIVTTINRPPPVAGR